MTWATIGNILTTNLEAASDSPADARDIIRKAIVELQNVVNGLDTTGGAAKIESTGIVGGASTEITGISSKSGSDLTLTSATEMVKVSKFINLTPVAYANLPASAAQGDMAFLTTDGAGDTQNQMIYYNGSAWKYFNSTADGGTDATVDAS